MNICKCAGARVYIHTYIHRHIHTYKHIYIQRERERERERDPTTHCTMNDRSTMELHLTPYIN